MTRPDVVTSTGGAHPVACWCKGNSSDATCPTRWVNGVGATNCQATRPHRGHAWTKGGWKYRCRGVRLRDWRPTDGVRRYRSYEGRRGRLYAQVNPWALNLPRLAFGQDRDATYLALTYGNGNSDPVVMVELDLNGTRLGRVLHETYWRIAERRRRPAQEG